MHIFLAVFLLATTASVPVHSINIDLQEMEPIVRYEDYEETDGLKYDINIDYTLEMVRNVYYGKAMELYDSYVSYRAKNEDLGDESISLGDFLNDYEENVYYLFGFHTNEDYLTEMIGCCLTGDMQSGRIAAKARNAKIDTLGLDETKIDFDDLYLLSKIITSEAGSDWLSIEWKMMVGEVVLNRVESEEFPDTIRECIYQDDQYAGSRSKYFAELIPYEDCVNAAVQLLSGERIINDPSVVFQANFKQGSGVYKALYDSKLGYTYFCYSNHPELYGDE